jgi:hypothetical protein
MGHKRYGYLPKSKRWLIITEELDKFASSGNGDIRKIANLTLQHVRTHFDKLKVEPSVLATFEYLLQLSKAYKTDSPLEYLQINGILDESELSLIKIGRGLQKYTENSVASKELQAISVHAGIDALNKWFMVNNQYGLTLFNDKLDYNLIFGRISNAGNFSDLTRLYFSGFTEKFLKYFLERTASTTFVNLNDRHRFKVELEKHLNDISTHAFETTKITQSLIAAWHNKHLNDSFPDRQDIKEFLSFSFDKMKGELLREEVH